MTPDVLEPLRDRRISGVVALAPRSFAIATMPAPRLYLWVHLDRKEASLALAPDLPIAPDPRGSRFGGFETPARGLVIAEVSGSEDGLRLELAPESGSPAAAEIASEAGGRRVNLVLRAADGTVLWALHRDEAAPDGAAPSPPPAGFHPARVTTAEREEEREALRQRIARSFREDFERELKKSLDGAEPHVGRHPSSSWISRWSHAWAIDQSRFTVATEIASAVAVSSIDIPPKKRHSTMRLWRGERWCSRSKA